MYLVAIDPDLSRFERQVSRVVDDFFGDLGRQTVAPSTRPHGKKRGGWSPHVDAYETEDKFIVQAELPGILKDKVNVEVRKDELTIRGEQVQEEEKTKGTAHITERRYGVFSRTIALPPDVDADKSKANYENGVLVIELPKTGEAKPKKIPVS